MKKIICLLPFLSLWWLSAQTSLPLHDMSAFRSQAGNWQIAGEVTIDRNIDIHDHEHHRQAVTFQKGTGILLNINDDSKRDNLVTAFEHGDIELELEVMIPKGSNSGIYLQGRYEVQLLDSWGVKNPGFPDIGGIFRNWENEPGKILKGIPPSSNPAKAPGLWQQMKIRFMAPRFDAEGNKLANARFEYVELNGVRIHSHIEVALPTGGPIAHHEVPMGPLMIQGDHGPVAFRNIRYTLLSESQVSLCELSYKRFLHDFINLDELETLAEIEAEKTDVIQVQLAQEQDKYGLVFDGKIVIPKEDDYQFTVGYSGGFRLVVNGKKLIEHNNNSSKGIKEGTIHLPKGTFPFQLSHIKNAGWYQPSLGLTVQTASTHPKDLHAYSSYPKTVRLTNPIFVNPGASPRMLRAFVKYKGDGPTLTQTIGLGHPGGVNYVFDLQSAQLLAAWRGDFVDATPMWNNRGNGSFNPNGATLWRFLGQPIAQLADASAPFPTTYSITEKGYRIDPETQLPIFMHQYRGVEIETHIEPDPEHKYLIQTLHFSNVETENWYVKLAEGEVKKMPDGSFAIADQTHYINILSDQKPVIREIEGKTELLLPVDGNFIQFEIIW